MIRERETMEEGLFGRERERKEGKGREEAVVVVVEGRLIKGWGGVEANRAGYWRGACTSVLGYLCCICVGLHGEYGEYGVPGTKTCCVSVNPFLVHSTAKPGMENSREWEGAGARDLRHAAENLPPALGSRSGP